MPLVPHIVLHFVQPICTPYLHIGSLSNVQEYFFEASLLAKYITLQTSIIYNTNTTTSLKSK
jgi:hypothetical protein